MKKLFENVGDNKFRIAYENRFAANTVDNPNASFGVMPGVWDNPKKVAELKKQLETALNAGNFELAVQLVDELSSYHN